MCPSVRSASVRDGSVSVRRIPPPFIPARLLRRVRDQDSQISGRSGLKILISFRLFGLTFRTSLTSKEENFEKRQFQSPKQATPKWALVRSRIVTVLADFFSEGCRDVCSSAWVRFGRTPENPRRRWSIRPGTIWKKKSAKTVTILLLTNAHFGMP